MAENGSERVLGALRLSLEAAAGLGYASFLIAHAELEPAEPSPSVLLYWIGALLLIAWPLCSPLLGRRLEGRPAATWFARWSLLASAVPLILLDTDVPAHWLLAVLTLGQGHLLVRYRANRAAAWTLALAPTQVLAAMAAAPGRTWLVLFPIAVAISGAGLVLLSWRQAERELEERAPLVFLREWFGQRKGWDSASEIRRRLRGVVPISLAVLAATVVLYPLLAAIPRPSLVPNAELDRQENGDGRGGRRRPTAEREAFERIFPSSIQPGAGIASLAHETVMTVRAFPAGESEGGALNLGSLYLRGLCLDTFTETDLRLHPDSKPIRLRDEEDRTGRDGWVVLAGNWPSEVIFLEIRQQVLRMSQGRWDVLFAPQPLLAVEASEIHHDPDGLLAFERDEDAVELGYSLLVDRPDPVPRELARQALVHSNPRFLQLPPSSDDLVWIARRAEELTRGKTNDYRRLRAILDHFDEDYRYSLDTSDVPGPEGIVDFMRRRKGHCTSYAAAAVLLLRTQRIPSRVATGFLAKEYSEEQKQYVVSTSNGHAWIEVHFEESGWVPFDPTPPRRREEALAAAAAGLGEGLGTWLEELTGDLRTWAESGADEAYLAILLETLADGPRALQTTFLSDPLRTSVVFLALVIGTVVLRRLWRRRRDNRSSTLVDGKRRKRSRLALLIERLVGELARRGHARGPGQTLQEVAGRASRRLETEPELPSLVKILYAARFGDRPMNEREYSRVERWIEESREQMG